MIWQYMIFVAYELNLPLNMENPHYRSQRAGEWSLIWAHDSRPIYRALTYIAVPLLGPHQPRYIGLTLYCTPHTIGLTIKSTTVWTVAHFPAAIDDLLPQPLFRQISQTWATQHVEEMFTTSHIKQGPTTVLSNRNNIEASTKWTKFCRHQFMHFLE